MNDVNFKYNEVFEPEYYIILEKNNKSYNLITYRDRGIFKFDELPYTLKEMIITKCLEQPNTLYNHITDFVELKTDLGLENDSNSLSIMQEGGMDFENNGVFLILDSDKISS